MTEKERVQIQTVHTWALPRTPGSRVIQSDGWLQLVSEDYKSPAFNEVLFNNTPASQIEDRIVETIEMYKTLGTDFKWCVHPHSMPTEMPTLLEKHGFSAWQSRVMYMRTSEMNFTRAIPSVEVHKVEPSEMDFFSDLFNRCWNIKSNECELMKRQLLFDHEQANVCYERFVAFVNGTAAGVASMVRNEECGYLHATAVLPEFHGKGAYRAMVDHRIQILKLNGAQLAITGARENTSAPRLAKMGFQSAWPLKMFLKKTMN